MSDAVFDPETLQRFADLTICFGANVQPDQVVAIGAEIGKEEMVRALAASAYRHGARFVDVAYFDMHVKRARIEHAREESLDYVPPWYGERLLALGEQRCARIGLAGPATPGLLDDLDPRRVGRDQLPSIKEAGRVVNERTTNWTIVPFPTQGWAEQVFPALEPAAAMERLRDEVLHVCRMDTDDPIAAWRERGDFLVAQAGVVTGRRFDALRFDGPGTELTVGLLPSSQFIAARFETVDGIVHMPNLPSEEIFSTPDPQRADGVVRATKPLVIGGTIVSDLEVEFRGGRAVRIEAGEGADVLRGYAERDAGACRLGEVALVDGEGRIGRLGTTFFDTLLDENAASHIALGQSYGFALGDEADVARGNQSAIHVDFMIGADAVSVTGIDAGGADVPVLHGGAWQL